VTTAVYGWHIVPGIESQGAAPRVSMMVKMAVMSVAWSCMREVDSMNWLASQLPCPILEASEDVK